MRNNIVAGVIIVIFALASVFTIHHGVTMREFGKHFVKEADESRAMVTNCERHEETHTDSDGNTTTDITYYVWIDLHVDGLPSSVKLTVTSAEFDHVNRGSETLIYFLPNDAKHITLSREHWLYEGTSDIFGGVCMLIVDASFALVYIGSVKCRNQDLSV